MSCVLEDISMFLGFAMVVNLEASAADKKVCTVNFSCDELI
jgi:hypothetical protein